MADLHKQIDDLEKRAAESALIADLATDPESHGGRFRRRTSAGRPACHPERSAFEAIL
jgi:hypothetical protein